MASTSCTAASLGKPSCAESAEIPQDTSTRCVKVVKVDFFGDFYVKSTYGHWSKSFLQANLKKPITSANPGTISAAMPTYHFLQKDR